jgi:hypothetical protein
MFFDEEHTCSILLQKQKKIKTNTIIRTTKKESEGNIVMLCDVTGRVLATKQDYGTTLRFDVPASGAYMNKIGNHAARKMVVIR